jgi:ketosteroid isomerase-like protein
MKKTLLIVTLYIISLPVAKCQEKLSADVQAVQNTIIQMFEALSNRDSVSLKTYCTSDILLFEYGSTWNLDTLINKAIRKNRAADFKRINIISFIDTKVDKHVAWATYNNQAEITQNGVQRKIKWIETVILVRENKKWKIKVLHSTFLKGS